MRLPHIAILACCLTGCMSDDVDPYIDDAQEETESELDESDAGVPARALAELELDDEAEDEDEDLDDVLNTGPGDEESDDEGDDAIEFEYRQCVHEMDSKRPKLTKDTQRRTKQVLAHVAKRTKMAPGFHKLLRLVALREASYQSGLVHRLQPDLEGSLSAWRKMSKRYEGSPYADDASLWQTYGLFGMNSNYFTMLWDRKGDPRVLCDPIVDIIVYRRAAARALRKLGGTIRCRNARGEAYDYHTEPTWATIHRAVNGGKLCPSKREEQAAIMRKYFKARANRVGLDADQRVTAKMLGVEPETSLDGEPWDSQEEMVMGLWEEIEALDEDS